MIERVLKQNVETDLERVKIEFGLRVIRNEIPKFVLLFFIFAMWGSIMELLALLFFLLPIRTEAGGLHVKTLTGCVVVTLLYCVGIVLLAHFNIPPEIQMGCLAIAGVLFWRFAPALSRKRQAQISYDREHLRRVILLIFCVDVVTIMVMLRTAPGQFANIGVWTLLIQSLQLPVIQLRRKRENDQETAGVWK